MAVLSISNCSRKAECSLYLRFSGLWSSQGPGRRDKVRDESDTKMKMKVKLSTDEVAKEGAVGLPEAVTRDSTAAGANTVEIVAHYLAYGLEGFTLPGQLTWSVGDNDFARCMLGTLTSRRRLSCAACYALGPLNVYHTPGRRVIIMPPCLTTLTNVSLKKPLHHLRIPRTRDPFPQIDQVVEL